MSPEEQMRAIANKPSPMGAPPLTTQQRESSAVSRMQLSIDAQSQIEQEKFESYQDMANKKSFLDAIADNEFWFRDIPPHARTGVKNGIAQTLGFFSDIVGGLSSIPMGGPGVLPANAVVATADLEEGLKLSAFQPETFTAIPGNSEHMAELVGGDPNHPTWLPVGLVAPGPGEFVGGTKAALNIAVSGMMVGPRRGYKLGKLDDFLARGDLPAFDEKAWQETGWYKGDDGQPRFFLSDADSTINNAFFESHPAIVAMKERAGLQGVGQFETIHYKVSDVLKHDELFEIYPELANLRVSSTIGVDGAFPTEFHFVDPSNPNGKGGMSMFTSDVVGSIKTQNLKSFDDFHETILHEIQHVVQKIERFAQGGTTKVDWKALDHIEATSIMENTFDLIDAGSASVDDLFEALVKQGATEELAQKTIGDPLVQKYLAGDEGFRAEAAVSLAGARRRAMDEVGFVLDYLFRDEDRMPEGMRLITRLKEELVYVDLQELAFRSYENLYGEAEARLTAELRNLTRAQIDKLPAPPHPAQASRTFLHDKGARLSVDQAPRAAQVREVQ